MTPKVHQKMLAAMILSAPVFAPSKQGDMHKCLLCNCIVDDFFGEENIRLHDKKCIWLWAKRVMERVVERDNESKIGVPENDSIDTV